jgi:DNA-directed RNA polymerase subunit M/transcription elongation factor TFIIS
MKILRFCPRCEYYLYLSAGMGVVNQCCKNCGYTAEFKPASSEEALILETQFRSGSSATGAASGITIGPFVKYDPTLPHDNMIRCPKPSCPSNGDPNSPDTPTRDVIYIKIDPQNLKFQYICTVCDEEWLSA